MTEARASKLIYRREQRTVHCATGRKLKTKPSGGGNCTGCYFFMRGCCPNIQGTSHGVCCAHHWHDGHERIWVQVPDKKRKP